MGSCFIVNVRSIRMFPRVFSVHGWSGERASTIGHLGRKFGCKGEAIRTSTGASGDIWRCNTRNESGEKTALEMKCVLSMYGVTRMVREE